MLRYIILVFVLLLTVLGGLVVYLRQAPSTAYFIVVPRETHGVDLLIPRSRVNKRLAFEYEESLNYVRVQSQSNESLYFQGKFPLEQASADPDQAGICLYRKTIDNSPLHKIVCFPPPARHYSPQIFSVSSDQKFMAYVDPVDGEVEQLKILNMPQGTYHTSYTVPSGYVEFEWVPNTHTLIIYQTIAERSSLFIATLDDGHFEKIGEIEGTYRGIHCSANAQYCLVIERNPDARLTLNMYQMAPTPQLVHSEKLAGEYLSSSFFDLESEWLYFTDYEITPTVARPRDYTMFIYRMRLDGSDKELLYQRQDFTIILRGLSPDSKQVLFNGYRCDTCAYLTLGVNLADKQVTEFPPDAMVWSVQANAEPMMLQASFKPPEAWHIQEGFWYWSWNPIEQGWIGKFYNEDGQTQTFVGADLNLQQAYRSTTQYTSSQPHVSPIIDLPWHPAYLLIEILALSTIFSSLMAWQGFRRID